MAKYFPIGLLALSLLLYTGCGTDAHVKGEEALAKGDYALAAKYFRKAAAKNPDSVDIFYNLAAACHRAGDIQGAASAYREVLRFVPGDMQSLEGLAAVLRETGTQSALASSHGHLSEILGYAAPGNEKARILASLALTEWALGREDLALGHLLAAKEEAPLYPAASFNLAKLLGDGLKLYPEATKEAELLLSVCKDDEAKKLASSYANEISVYLKENGRPETEPPKRAIEEYRQGLVARGKGNLAAAESAFSRALSIDPGYYDAALALADLLNSANRLPEAYAAYGRACAAGPGQFEPAYKQALVAYKAKSTDDAIRILVHKAIPLWPARADSYMLLAYSYCVKARYYEARLFGSLYSAKAKAAGVDTAQFDGWLKSLPAAKFTP